MFKINAIIVSLFLALNASSVFARTCKSIFAPAGNNLHTKLESIPKSKGNVLLIHGLGDNLTHLNKLAGDFKRTGYTVLRIDLHGHGKTLENFEKTGEYLPTVLPFENNVYDLTETIKKMDFKNPIIIGHSYGGAIAHALANNLQGHRSFRPTRLVLLAPYLRRLDHSFLTGNPIIDAQTEYMTEQFMRRTYREYFESQKIKNIDLHVNAAIATTKGIRSFDLLSSGKKASLDFKIPLLVIAGTKDELVKEGQIDNFHKKLQNEGYTHRITSIDADHFFPRTHAAETFTAILKDLNRP